jgi:UDP-glucose:(heptosyl)LPS alpha-1,3-glucosyltransferase
MKLAIVRKRFGRSGGAERFIIDIMHALAGRDVETWLLSEHFEEPGELAERWIRIPQSRGSRLKKQIGFERNVALALREKGPFLVQSHERMLEADIFRAGDGVHAAWIDRLRRERPWWRRPFTGRDGFHRHIIDTERRMARDTGMIFVANSGLVARELREWLGVPEGRIRIIENGVDLKRFRPATPEQRAAARRYFGLEGAAPVAAFVGSGFERKGAFALLEALALPRSRDMRAIIAGGDRAAGALARRIEVLGLSGRVRAIGAVTNVLPALHAADLFVLPSLYDPMPNAALEALACGLPVVTTPDTGIADAIAETGAGAVTSRDPDALAAGMAEVVSRRKAASIAAAALAQRFDLRHSAEQWLDFYREFT